jgi:NADPH-dependent 2,4-dienoyl-CoA reductase/sulfur reductase-like enzyme
MHDSGSCPHHILNHHCLVRRPSKHDAPDQIYNGNRVVNIIKTIPEPNKTVDVVRECDVVVVGGGPGGIGAAVSAARNGVDTVLIERHGYLEGMGTGGLVTIIPCLRKQLIAQDVPMPGVYPARHRKAAKDRVAIYESPAFGERVSQKRNELPEVSGISGRGEH